MAFLNTSKRLGLRCDLNRATAGQCHRAMRMHSLEGQAALTLLPPDDGAGQDNQQQRLAGGNKREAGEGVQVAAGERADAWQGVGGGD